MILKIIGTSILTAIIVLIALNLASPPQFIKLSGTPGSVPSTIATSSSVEIGEGAEVLFPNSPAGRPCAARVVSTIDPILIQFDNTATSTLQDPNYNGHIQAASTTVTYIAETYGCEDWIVRSGGVASNTVQIIEFRQ